jgi:broad specificity phosphatase PhoE
VATLRLFVVRHGETAWTLERRFTGGRDIPLSARGVAEAGAVAQALAPHPVTAIYSSPLERCGASAEIIAKPHQLSVRMEPAFREMGFGAWEGLTRDDVEVRFPEAFAAWRHTPAALGGHGGESLPAVAERVHARVRELQDTHAGEIVVVVSHAVVIRLVVLEALGLGPDRLWSVDASPAGITELEFTRGWVTVHRMNTVAHLAALP